MLLFPASVHYVEPLGGARVAVVVPVAGDAVFRRPVRPPTGDDVEREAAIRDAVEVGGLLGQQRGMVKRGAHGDHDLQPLGDGGEGQAFLGRVEDEGGLVGAEFGAGGRAANVGRTQVEALAGDVDLDGVEECTVQDLHADDVCVLRGDELLHQRGGVECEDEFAPLGGKRQIFRGVEAGDGRAAAAYVRPHRQFGCS